MAVAPEPVKSSAPAPKPDTAKTAVPNVGISGRTAASLAAPLGPSSVSPAQFAVGQAAKTQGSLDQYINYLNTNMGRLSADQANAELRSELSPTLAGLAQEQAAGGQAIGQYTSQLASSLAGVQPGIAGAYTQAEGQQAAIDAALAQQLTTGGTAAAGQLAATLAQRGQDTAPAAALAAQGKGLAGANLATGSASLSALVGEGAAANAYGKTLPGIANLAGRQSLGALEQGITQQANTAIGKAQAGYPTLVNQARSGFLAQEKNAESAYLGELARQISQQNANTAATRAANTATYQQGQLGVTQQKAADQRAYQQGELQVRQGQLTVAQRRAQIAQEQANTAKLKAVTAAEKAPSTGVSATLLKSAAKMAESFYYGVAPKYHYDTTAAKWLPVPGTGSAAVPYPQALQQLIAAGPSTAAWRQKATQILNSLYAPGEGGRPPTKAQARLNQTIAKGGASLFGPLAPVGFGAG